MVGTRFKIIQIFLAVIGLITCLITNSHGQDTDGLIYASPGTTLSFNKIYLVELEEDYKISHSGLSAENSNVVFKWSGRPIAIRDQKTRKINVVWQKHPGVLFGEKISKNYYRHLKFNNASLQQNVSGKCGIDNLRAILIENPAEESQTFKIKIIHVPCN